MRGGIADREQRILKLAYETRSPISPIARASSNGSSRPSRRRRRATARLTILMMDLDRFKYVNDTLGHGVGDHVLREVSARLQRTVTRRRMHRAPGRRRVRHPPAACAATTGLHRDRARRSSPRSKRRSCYEDQPLDVGTQHRHRALPRARAATRRRWCATPTSRCTPPSATRRGFAVYDQHYDTSQQEHLSLLGELRRAVERNELRLYYQPKVSLHSSHVQRRRSADPLGASDARPRAAGAVHSVRRAHRLHQTTHALGAPRGDAPVRRMAARGPARCRSR